MMIAEYAQSFNRNYSAEAAQRRRWRVEADAECPITFPLSSRPVFVEWELAHRLLETVEAIFAHVRQPAYRKEALEWVPKAYRRPGEVPEVPEFSTFDFALGRTPDGALRPYLLECQGISSLMGLTPWLGHVTAEETAPETTPFLSHEEWGAYARDLRALLEDAVLIDVDVHGQRLRADFGLLRRFAGVRLANLDRPTLDALAKYPRRVYSRVVPVDAERSGCADLLSELYRQDHDWIWSPEWFYMLSKHSLPSLGEVTELVPTTVPLTPETAATWGRRDDVVLKPTDDFGGRGVNLYPTPGDVEDALAGGIPHVLQERVELTPVVQPPEGPPLFCDLRVLCLGERPVALFGRLARHLLHNISFNAAYPWCGITVVLLPREGAA